MDYAFRTWGMRQTGSEGLQCRAKGLGFKFRVRFKACEETFHEG